MNHVMKFAFILGMHAITRQDVCTCLQSDSQSKAGLGTVGDTPEPRHQTEPTALTFRYMKASKFNMTLVDPNGTAPSGSLRQVSYRPKLRFDPGVLDRLQANGLKSQQAQTQDKINKFTRR